MTPAQQDILKKLSSARLPTLSHVLVKLLAVCQDDHAGTNELVRLIEQEPTMVQKILSIANSSAYIHTGPHIKLESSLLVIGTDMVRMLIINESIFQNFRSFSKNIRLDLRSFWYHSLTTAMIAHNMCRYMHYENADKAYLAGLLHDIGRLALMMILPEKYAPLFYRKDNKSLCIQETNTIGISHAHAGAWLTRYWKLPEDIAESIELHHNPHEKIKDAPPLVKIIHIANTLAHYEEDTPMFAEVALKYGLNAATISAIMPGVHQRVIEAATYLGIDLSNIHEAPPNIAELSETNHQSTINREILTLLNSAEFGRFFSRQTSQAHLQQAAILAACNILHLDHALLLWHNPTDEKYTCTATDEPIRKLLGISIPSTPDSLVTQTALQKQPYFISSTDIFIVEAEKNLALAMGQNNWIIIPIMDAEKTHGVLFGNLEPEHLNNLRDKNWLTRNFVNQFMLSWHRLHKTKKHIQEEITRIQEKYQHLSKTPANKTESPLAIVKNYLQLLNKKLEKHGTEKNAVAVLNEEISGLEKILNDMATPGQEETQTDMITLIPEVIVQFKKSEPSITITEINHSQQSSVWVKAPDNILKQVLTDLLRNIISHIKKRGEIILTHQTGKERKGEPFYNLTISCQQNQKNTRLPLSSLPFPGKSRKDTLQEMDISIVYELLDKMGAWIGSHSDTRGITFDIQIPAASITNREKTLEIPETKTHSCP